MKLKLLFILSLFFISTSVLLITSCKKYEEGPAFSLMTKKARIVNQWELSEIYVNGQAQNINSLNETLDIKSDDVYIATTNQGTETGTWTFGSDKETITFTPNNSSEAATLTILRLKNKELWLEYIYKENSETYEIEARYKAK